MPCNDMQNRRSRKTILSVALLLVFALVSMPQIGMANLNTGSTKPKKISAKKAKAKRGKVRAPSAAAASAALASASQELAALGASCAPPANLKEKAQEFLGVPYRAGGSSKNGTDCSGLTKQIFSRLYGVELPHSSVAQSQLPNMAEVSEERLQPGDLVFFGPGKKRINHVGVYLADGKFLHASRTVGVTVSELDDKYWQNRLIALKRPMGLDPGDGDDEEIVPRDQDQGSVSRGEIVTSFGRSAANHQRHQWSSHYRRNLAGEGVDLRVGGFLEARQPEIDLLGFEPADGNSQLERPADPSQHWRFSQGMKLAAAMRPFSWLELSPALSYRSAPDAESSQGRTNYRPQLGIDALLAPVNSRWALAMSTYRGTTGSAADTVSSQGREDSSRYDLSVGLRYRLSDDLLLSVMGSHDSSMTAMANRDAQPGEAVDNVSFRFDYRF